MKRFLTLLVLLLSLLDIQAQDMYKISSTSTYNIRTSPSTKSEILGNTTGISSLEVYEIKDGWAKIKYGADTAYVKSDCLSKQSTLESNNKQKTKDEEIEDSKWMIFVSFCLSILLAVFVVKRLRDETLRGSTYWINLLAFNLLCAIEWLHMATADNSLMWFLNAGEVGGMFFLNIIYFGFLVIVQSLSFYFTMIDIKYYYGAKFNLYFGLWSIPGVIVFAILAGSLWGENAVWTTILLFFLCQILQVILVFKGVFVAGGLIPALIGSFTYILGFITTLIVASIFFIILLFFYFFKSDVKEIHHYHY